MLLICCIIVLLIDLLTDEDQCFICCKESTNSTCKPFNDEMELPLPDGSFCEGGTCQNVRKG